jgi:hypothetical protein
VDLAIPFETVKTKEAIKIIIGEAKIPFSDVTFVFRRNTKEHTDMLPK